MYKLEFQVPGRMGLVITLYLILINSYTSVKAPPRRGFSFIELWFGGVQLPIIVAVLEYGFILAYLKFHETDSKTKEIIMKKIDMGFVIFSFLLYVIFNAFYWNKIMK